MKRLVPALAAALLALTACAPAADSTPAATPEPTAAPEPTAEPVGELHAYLENEGYAANTLYQAQIVFDANAEFAGTNVYKTDFTTGQTTLFRHDDYEGVSGTSPIVTDDSLYVLTHNEMKEASLLAMPLDGSETRQIALDTNSWNTPIYSNRYMYCISRDGAPTARTRGLRLDLQTGETEPWDIPVETFSILGVADGGIVTSRIISDHPIPLPSDSEMLDAILQNSTYEFDLTDAATGQPIQKIFEYPCDGVPEGDGHISYCYTGRNGSDYYFLAEHAKPVAGYTSTEIGTSVLRVGSDGTQEDLGIMTSQAPIRPLYKGEEIGWFVVPHDDSVTDTIYDLQGNEIGRTAAPAGAEVYHPVRLLDDGRVILCIGYDQSHDYMPKFATIPADAYLSGSTEYTEMAYIE
ncbi:hypothetical protein [Gemmiger sp.]